MLQETFIELLKKYTKDEFLINELWTEVKEKYSGNKRHYHSLNHIEKLLRELIQIKGNIQNWETILFTLYYHDIIYSAISSDNEEKSALLAKKRMKQIAAPKKIIDHCACQILAMKAHALSEDSDTNYFTDADLSVLGQDWETYSEYAKKVRKEYIIYPDFVYNPGRKKVLIHFLGMERIYKTDLFFDKLEPQAKENLTKELNLLNE